MLHLPTTTIAAGMKKQPNYKSLWLHQISNVYSILTVNAPWSFSLLPNTRLSMQLIVSYPLTRLRGNHFARDLISKLQSSDTITVPYKQANRIFETFTRPIWDWVLSLVQDPRLSSCFVWDAEKAYRFTGDIYMRFYHEPRTANAFWDAQSALPNHPDAKLVGLIVYVDKSKLSTVGTEKTYAVVARVANIAVSVRNSNNQFGGGQVVGHQPVVKEDANENNKQSFSNFKTVVWHAAFWKLLESLVHHAKLGSWTMCGDEVLCWLWPIILILASDYEEACVMALIRGVQALYP
ncbi:hypothetical protein K438DRAFT_1784209 [Mycena galopus ATCC 62051]|nr:hypothetical protein K438DRAFT_1784209 [Mycena galopus ATCC 62051]